MDSVPGSCRKSGTWPPEVDVDKPKSIYAGDNLEPGIADTTIVCGQHSSGRGCSGLAGSEGPALLQRTQRGLPVYARVFGVPSIEGSNCRPKNNLFPAQTAFFCVL